MPCYRGAHLLQLAVTIAPRFIVALNWPALSSLRKLAVLKHNPVQQVAANMALLWFASSIQVGRVQAAARSQTTRDRREQGEMRIPIRACWPSQLASTLLYLSIFLSLYTV